jgi:hypothetical protein
VGILYPYIKGEKDRSSFVVVTMNLQKGWLRSNIRPAAGYGLKGLSHEIEMGFWWYG